jgi:hypothetical protein
MQNRTHYTSSCMLVAKHISLHNFTQLKEVHFHRCVNLPCFSSAFSKETVKQEFQKQFSDIFGYFYNRKKFCFCKIEKRHGLSYECIFCGISESFLMAHFQRDFRNRCLLFSYFFIYEFIDTSISPYFCLLYLRYIQ